MFNKSIWCSIVFLTCILVGCSRGDGAAIDGSVKPLVFSFQAKNLANRTLPSAKIMFYLPQNNEVQKVIDYSIKAEGMKGKKDYVDSNGNTVVELSFEQVAKDFQANIVINAKLESGQFDQASMKLNDSQEGSAEDKEVVTLASIVEQLSSPIDESETTEQSNPSCISHALRTVSAAKELGLPVQAEIGMVPQKGQYDVQCWLSVSSGKQRVKLNPATLESLALPDGVIIVRSLDPATAAFRTIPNQLLVNAIGLTASNILIQ